MRKKIALFLLALLLLAPQANGSQEEAPEPPSAIGLIQPTEPDLTPASQGESLQPAQQPSQENPVTPPQVLPAAVAGGELEKPVAVPQPPTFVPRQRNQRFEQKPEQRAEPDTAVLNFVDANLRDILRTISEITGTNFIVAPGVTAKISVQTARPIPRKEVFAVFESILEANGLAAIKSGSYYKIVQSQNARQRALELRAGKDPAGLPQGDGLMNMIAPVNFISANDLLQILRPMLSPAGNAVNFQKANILIITDTASNIRGFLEIINLLDTDALSRASVAVLPAKNVDIKTLNRELTDIFAALGLGKDTPQLAVIPLERLNSLVVLAPTPEALESVKGWIARLDVPPSGEGSAIHIYYVQNDKASNIKNLLDQLYGEKKPAAASTPQTAQPAQAVAPIKYDRYDNSRDDIKIHIFESANALIIQSSQGDYQNILNTIRELDHPPKQVLIDALIIEVKLDDTLKFGVQWSVLAGNFNIQQNTGIVSSILNNPRGVISAPAGQAAASGLTVFATDASSYFAVVQALASTGKVDVLSNPHIVVKNYEKASINVGSDEPVATQSTQTAVTGTAGLIQTIEYRKTGVILTVTPQITEGGMIAMSIRQEVSDKSTDRTVGNAIYPSFTKREAETSVVARDKETLVIGGLIQEKTDHSSSGIPLLSKIPVLGNLFKFTTNVESRTELIILLTPTVISDYEEGRIVTKGMKDKLEGLKKFFDSMKRAAPPRP